MFHTTTISGSGKADFIFLVQYTLTIQSNIGSGPKIIQLNLKFRLKLRTTISKYSFTFQKRMTLDYICTSCNWLLCFWMSKGGGGVCHTRTPPHWMDRMKRVTIVRSSSSSKWRLRFCPWGGQWSGRPVSEKCDSSDLFLLARFGGKNVTELL